MKNGRLRFGGQICRNGAGGVGSLRDRLKNVVGEKISQLLLALFAAVAACGEAARADLGTENIFIQGDIFCAGVSIGVAGGGCGVEVHGVSHRRCG